MSDNKTKFVRKLYCSNVIATRSQAIIEHCIPPRNKRWCRMTKRNHPYLPWPRFRGTSKRLGPLVQFFADACNMQVNRSTKQTPLRFVFSRHSPEPTLLDSGSALPTDHYAKECPQVLRSKLETRMCSSQANGDVNMATFQQRYKRY